MDITVAICAYNAEKRIGMVLESLADQVVPASLEWELIVIDNASTDRTAELSIDMGRRLRLPLRVVHEPEPGLANARRKASFEARAAIISFLDDDNVVGKDWVAACHSFMREHAKAGIVGARVVPLFEDPADVPADFDRRFAGLLSMYDAGDQPKQVRPEADSLPVGAGMTGRAEIFRFVFGELGSVAVGRKGTSLAGGEDLEAVYVAAQTGWEVWYTPSMLVKHWVPRAKLTTAYEEKWWIDTARCHAWLTVLSGRSPNVSRLAFGLRWLEHERKALLQGSRRFLPARFWPKRKTPEFWRRYYRSQGAGWRDLMKNYGVVETFLATVRKRAARSPHA